MPIKLNSTGGGSVTLDVPSMSTANTLVLPAKSGNIITSADTGTISQTMLGAGVAGNGPSFSATMSANQTVTGSTWTKINFNTEVWDTNNCYDTSLYRFTPNVAGYYQINGYLWRSAGAIILLLQLYKNGSAIAYSPRMDSTSGAYAVVYGVGLNTMVYCNGTTDYLELYGYTNNTSWESNYTSFQGFLARAA